MYSRAIFLDDDEKRCPFPRKDMPNIRHSMGYRKPLPKVLDRNRVRKQGGFVPVIHRKIVGLPYKLTMRTYALPPQITVEAYAAEYSGF